MPALRLQIASLVILASDFPRYPTFARYCDFVTGGRNWTIRRIREGWEPFAEFSLLKIEHCIFAEWYVFGKEVMEVV